MTGMPHAGTVHVVGIGADGWASLTDEVRETVLAAAVIVGAPRQLDLLPTGVPGRRLTWPSPLAPAVPGMLAEHAADGLVVLASGDPMHYGIGRLLARHLPAGCLLVHPHPSSISLACARLGWAVEETEVVSAVGRDVRTLAAVLHAGRRVLVLSAGSGTPAEVARVLCESGFGPSLMTVLADLEAPTESTVGPARATSSRWETESLPDLQVVAIDCVREDAAVRLGLVPGLPDEAYTTDGQMTKWEVRALALAALAPAPGELLWDVGGGTGTVAIEWMRAHRTCRAVCIERRSDRAVTIAHNSVSLGVPGLQVVQGRAPEALAGLPTPDAVFIGGGLTSPDLVVRCWDALAPGGRLVAHTVTLESEALLVELRARYGGRLARLEISRAEPLGGFSGWRPARPITQWSVVKAPDGLPAEPLGERSGEALVEPFGEPVTEPVGEPVAEPAGDPPGEARVVGRKGGRE